MAKKSRKRVRAARGTGTVFYSESRKLWIGRVVVGRTAKGKTRYVERSAATQGELIEKLKSASPPGPETTVGEWADRWLASAGCRASTKGLYAYNARRFFKPQLGHIPVAKLTAHDCECAIREWAKPKGPLGQNTLRVAVGQLVNMLNAARRARLITENPAALVRRPRAKRLDVDPLPPADLERVIALAASRADWRVYALLASVGCRIGEALALDVGDWDPVARTVTITRTYTKEHGLRSTKSEYGVRTVRVPEPAAEVVAASAAGRSSGPLFPARMPRRGVPGGRREHSAVQRGWATFLKKLGLPYRNLHQLRHSVATALISAAVPPGDVAKYLGDTVETVVRTYLHPTGVDPSAAFERLLGGGKVGATTAPAA